MVSVREAKVQGGAWPDDSPDNLTWHHHGDTKTMELVDEKVHNVFTHTGGASEARKK